MEYNNIRVCILGIGGALGRSFGDGNINLEAIERLRKAGMHFSVLPSRLILLSSDFVLGVGDRPSYCRNDAQIQVSIGSKSVGSRGLGCGASGTV